jgi:hypothetical protein
VDAEQDQQAVADGTDRVAVDVDRGLGDADFELRGTVVGRQKATPRDC